MTAEKKDFIHNMNIVKAFPEERTGAARILIRASSEKEDRVGEVILKSAFADPSMRNDFIETGYLDYNHLTDIIDKEIQETKPKGVELANLQKEKAKAIIGYPEKVGNRDDFPSEYGIKDDGFYIEGRLIPDNEYAETIKSALASGMTGWGASVSGTASKSDFVGNRLHRIHLKKCAIQPLMESINPDTSVHLLKSSLTQLNNIRKSMFEIEDPVIAESDEHSRLKREYDNLIQIISEDEDISAILLDKIFTDIRNRVTNGSMELKSSVIKDFLFRNYGFLNETTEGLADTVLITLSGEY